MTLWVLCGDARSRWAAEYLQQQGFSVRTTGVPEASDSPLPDCFHGVILPFPSFSQSNLRGRSGMEVNEITRRLTTGSLVFGGLLGAHAAEFSAEGARVYDLYGTEPLTTGNAIPTAEGAIALAMELSPITIHSSRCLVAGFGRCGKILAGRLQALGAHVTVGVRRPADLALAEAMSMETEESGVWSRGLGSYDFIFNTVPAPIFSAEHAEQISGSCIFIELASRPGGIAPEDFSHLNYHFAPGLPGKAAPKTAGILYARSILQVLEKEGLR